MDKLSNKLMDIFPIPCIYQHSKISSLPPTPCIHHISMFINISEVKNMLKSVSTPILNKINETPELATRDCSFFTKHQETQFYIHIMEQLRNKYTRIRTKHKIMYKLEFPKFRHHLKVINDINSIRLIGPHSVRHYKELGANGLLKLLVKKEYLTPQPPSDALGDFYVELVIDQLLKCITISRKHADIIKWCQVGSFSIDLKKDLKILILTEVFNILNGSIHL